LRAPILVNLKTRKAVQVIALCEEYPIRYAVFPESARESMRAEALAGAEV
jgi:flagellar assembly factor FliW